MPTNWALLRPGWLSYIFFSRSRSCPQYINYKGAAAGSITLVTRFQTAEQTILHNQRYPSHILLPVIPSSP